jgi:hypothetical protein
MNRKFISQAGIKPDEKRSGYENALLSDRLT